MRQKKEKPNVYLTVTLIIAFILTFFAQEIRAIAKSILIDNWEKTRQNHKQP